jgi:hypothetical protein
MPQCIANRSLPGLVVFQPYITAQKCRVLNGHSHGVVYSDILMVDYPHYHRAVLSRDHRGWIIVSLSLGAQDIEFCELCPAWGSPLRTQVPKLTRLWLRPESWSNPVYPATLVVHWLTMDCTEPVSELHREPRLLVKGRTAEMSCDGHHHSGQA